LKLFLFPLLVQAFLRSFILSSQFFRYPTPTLGSLW